MEELLAKGVKSDAENLQQRALQGRENAKLAFNAVKRSDNTVQEGKSILQDYNDIRGAAMSLFDKAGIDDALHPADYKPEDIEGCSLQEHKDLMSRIAQECGRTAEIADEIYLNGSNEEAEIENTDKFVDISLGTGNFYQSIISDINDSYRYGIYDATLVLSRKMLENLLVDVMREKYPNKKKNLWFDTNSYQFERLSKLIDNFDDNLNDFKSYSNGVDGSLVDDLEDIRNDANDSAHTLETGTSAKEIGEYSKKVERSAKVLLRIKSNLS